MQQIIDYINKKLEKYSKVVSYMDKKYIGNEMKYTYHGGFDHGYSKGKLIALEDMKDELQALGDGWIQTSIRLPEPHKNVLLWEGGYEPLELNEPIIGWYDTRYGFRTKGDGPIATHWMPLPLPPKQ